MKNSQTEKILKYMESGRPITAIQALKKYGCFRLSARIYDIRQMGFDVEERRIKRRKKSFSQYRLAEG